MTTCKIVEKGYLARPSLGREGLFFVTHLIIFYRHNSHENVYLDGLSS